VDPNVFIVKDSMFLVVLLATLGIQMYLTGKCSKLGHNSVVLLKMFVI